MGDLTVHQWISVVRRARLGRTAKAVALMLATYADPDGTRVFPGLAQLAVDCELGYNVVKTALAALRRSGLVELVRPAARRGDSDEYRLILHPDVLDRVDILTPAAVKVAVERIRDARRGRYRPTEPADPDPDPADLRPTAQAAEPVDNSHLRPTERAAEPPPTARPAAHAVDAETRPAAHGDIHLRPTPLAPTLQDRPQELPTTPETDLRTDVTVVGDPPSEEDPISRPAKCHHGLTGTSRPDGSPACALCRVEARRAGRPALRLVHGGAA